MVVAYPWNGKVTVLRFTNDQRRDNMNDRRMNVYEEFKSGSERLGSGGRLP